MLFSAQERYTPIDGVSGVNRNSIHTSASSQFAQSPSSSNFTSVGDLIKWRGTGHTGELRQLLIYYLLGIIFLVLVAVCHKERFILVNICL